MTKIIARVTGTGHSSGSAVTAIDFTVKMSTVISDAHQERETGFIVDMAGGVTAGMLDLRTQVAAYMSGALSSSFTAADVTGVDDWVAKNGVIVPVNVAMSSLLAVDDIAQVIVPSIPGYSALQTDWHDWSVSARALISGTATLVVRNGAGTLMASRALTAPGVFAFTPTVSMINAGDRLRFGFTGIGLGLQDVNVTGWLRVPITAE